MFVKSLSLLLLALYILNVNGLVQIFETISIIQAPPYWPIQGSIAFQHVSLQYRSGQPLALSNVSFETEPGEKIGIVGRTGSGKSSLFLALFRMVEIQSGQILIDGINIKHLPLIQLR